MKKILLCIAILGLTQTLFALVGNKGPEEKLISQGKQIKKPRIMVVVHASETDISYIPIVVRGNKSIENFIENALQSEGFELMDATQFLSLKEVELALNKNNPSLLASTAKNFGADILVYGEVQREFINERQVHGTSYRFFSNQLHVKAVETSSGSVVYSGMRSKNPSALENIEPLLQASKELVSEMVRAIAKYPQKKVQQSKIQITIVNIAFSQLVALKKAIEDIEGVQTIAIKRFQEGVALLSVYYQGEVEQLAISIDAIRSPDITILRLEPNSLHARINQ